MFIDTARSQYEQWYVYPKRKPRVPFAFFCAIEGEGGAIECRVLMYERKRRAFIDPQTYKSIDDKVRMWRIPPPSEVRFFSEEDAYKELKKIGVA